MSMNFENISAAIECVEKPAKKSPRIIPEAFCYIVNNYFLGPPGPDPQRSL